MNPRERVEPGIFRRSGHYVVMVKVRGTQHTETLPEGATLRQARAKRAELLTQGEQRRVLTPSGITVNAFLDRWLADVEKTAKSPSTITAYKVDIRYWRAEIGALRLKNLTASEVEKARDALLSPIPSAEPGARARRRPGARRRALSAKSVKNSLGTLKVALNWGVRHDLLGRNVAQDVKAPSVTRFESHWASQEEAKRLLVVFDRNGAPHGTMLALALLTCLRVESEWGGMRWRDVDLKKRVAHLTKARLQDGTIVQAGNNKHKRRQIPLSDEAVRFLKIQQRWQTKMRDTNRGAWVDEEGFVFTNEFGERVRQSTLARNFEKMLVEANVPRMRVHDLRHTGATLLMAAGIHVKVVSEMLGHSSIKMTLDTYGHAVPGLAEAAADRLGQLLATPPTTGRRRNTPRDTAG